MSTLIMVVSIAVAVAGLAGFLAVLVGIRQEDRRRHLPERAQTSTATLARRVVGVHVRDDRANRAEFARLA